MPTTSVRMRAQGPDPDAGHGGQDLGKRVRRHEFLDLFGNLCALLAQRGELRGQTWQHDAGGVRAGDHDGLRGERGEDLIGEPAAEPWCLLEQPGPHLGLPGCGESGWGGPGFEHQHGGWSRRGPRTRSSAGWIWVSSPRILLLGPTADRDYSWRPPSTPSTRSCWAPRGNSSGTATCTSAQDRDSRSPAPSAGTHLRGDRLHRRNPRHHRHRLRISRSRLLAEEVLPDPPEPAAARVPGDHPRPMATA